MRMILSTAAAVLVTAVLAVGSGAPAQAQQAGNAEDICTPDVMRLCNEFVPDRAKITSCLRKKIRAVSKECKTAMRSYGGGKGGKHKRRHKRRHKA